jgi:integrative and conjugative element protein (TIGR02256 family)
MRETGGALLGWREGKRTVVQRVLGPGPKAKHGFRSFEPDASWQNEQGRRIYAESQRTVAYIGDWHTHPFGAPNPSRQDASTARLIAEDPGFRAPVPLYAILGKPLRQVAARPKWQIAIYEWRDDSFVPVRLHRLADPGRSSRGRP